jgi:hypothetical protein
MSAPATALLASLRKQGLDLYVHRGELKVKGFSATVPAAIHQKIGYFKEDLIELLLAEESQEPAAPDSSVDAAIADAQRTEALFDGNLRVQVRPDGAARWAIWVTRGAAWRRRKDSATPSLDHARRTAECWFGQPIGGWRVPEDLMPGPRPLSRKNTSSGRFGPDSSEYQFQVTQTQGRAVASIMVVLAEPADTDTRAIAEILAREVATRGFRIYSAFTVEAQANWISGGFDVTIRAFVTRARTARSERSVHSSEQSIERRKSL